MKKLLLVPLFFIILFPSCSEADNVARVIDVIDGDTILIEGGHLVRYIGIDAPEINTFYYDKAVAMNEELVRGKEVRLERDTSNKDRYGRLLRYVFIDTTFINGEMVKTGHALARAYPPDTKYQLFLEALEDEARQKKKGIWQDFK
jgi:micrococcal nuclease